jgi:hypothetical protein
VIFASGGSDPAKAVKAATSKIPIVFVSAADPLRTGLVASLNRPGANVTGVSLLASVLDAKKLDLLRQVVPQASTIGALINPNYPEAESQSDEFQTAASRLGVRSIVKPGAPLPRGRYCSKRGKAALAPLICSSCTKRNRRLPTTSLTGLCGEVAA